MKTIAVLVPTFMHEFSIEILTGITEFFRNKNVRIIISEVKSKKVLSTNFDYQKWVNVDYLSSESVDGYIIVSNLFFRYLDLKELNEIVEHFGNRPVVSISIDFEKDNTYTITSKAENAFFQIIEHLHKIHNCTKFAFFSGISTNSPEAQKRFEWFKSALQKENLTLNENLVFDGNFRAEESYKIIREKYSSKEQIDFDAIVCSTDIMAAGCIKAFDEIGVRVPEDVKVFGYADAIIAKISRPSFSTISQDIRRLGIESSQYILNILEGKNPQKSIFQELQPRYRQSCGCISLDNTEPVFLDSEQNLQTEEVLSLKQTTSFLNNLEQLELMINILDFMKGAHSLKQNYIQLKELLGKCNFESIYISLFEESQVIVSMENFTLPRTLEFCMDINKNESECVFEPGKFYNPLENLFPNHSDLEKPGFFILNPIYSGETNYGYGLFKIKSNDFAKYCIYLKLINSTISLAYDYSKDLEFSQEMKGEYSELAEKIMTDELTRILNRRGFLELGQSSISLMNEKNGFGVVLFADMDGLKKINDNYGHEMGDLAIKLEAQVLSQSFRATDIVGRLSGDEFGIIAVGMKKSYVEKVREKLKIASEIISKENNLPFTLSISVGATELKPGVNLKNLLKEADKELYKEKAIKHQALGK